MQTFVGGGNAILLLLTVLFLSFLGLVGFVAWRKRKTSVLRIAQTAGVLVMIVYCGLLTTAALSSKDRILVSGEIKWFCGFYLDCHLGVSVARVESSKTLPTSQGPVTANGIFIIVTLEFHNSAKNPALAMTVYQPRAAVVDSRGARFERNREAEEAVARDGQHASPLKNHFSVPHKPVFATLVFDVPTDADAPRLSVEEGFVVDRAIELVLVNDDNSFLHKQEYLALTPEAATQPSSYLRNGTRTLPRARLASR